MSLREWVPRPSFGAEGTATAWGPVRTRRQLLVATGTWVALSLGAAGAVAALTAPIWSAPAPPPVPASQTDDRRFGLSLEERRELFTALVRNEPRHRARAARHFPGDPFSINDDRSHGEMVDARQLARTRGLSISQVYLILDEGIRRRWPGPEGEPLEATVPPLDPRR